MAKRNVEDLYKLIQKNDQSFAFYRLPGEEVIHFCEGKEVQNLPNWTERKHFILYPFQISREEPSIHLNMDFTQGFFQNDFKKSAVTETDLTEILVNETTAKKEHCKLINSAISSIKKGELEKVVLARKVSFKKDTGFNALDYYLKLCRWYPNTFCYFAQTEFGGRWIGASPELLFKREGNSIETTSLAGTIRKNSGQMWRGKETVEQEIVSDYIESLFKDFGISDFKKSNLAELSMGTIAHLHNSYKANKEFSVSEMKAFIEALQPTPAVSGFPKDRAISYITNHENDQRNYYSGFVGPVKPEGTTNLYVNLRCMEITADELVVHAGGGITADSDEEEEWRETCLKANTLLCLV